MKIMIKKIIGVVAVVAILALIAFTAIGVGTYKSMLPEDMFTKKEVVATEPRYNTWSYRPYRAG